MQTVVDERFGWRLHLESTIAEAALAVIDFNPKASRPSIEHRWKV